jgi:sialic acid synthase SpsE
MCTFFNADKLRKYHHLVDTIKIASSDIMYIDLLKAANETKKPVLLSLAGAYAIDIDHALSYLEDCQVKLLFCHGEYPSKTHDLSEIEYLRLSFQNEVGYSDHSIDIFTPFMAAKYFDCEIIEKHFKLRDMETPDSPHSLNPKEFRMMVDLINGADIGTKTKDNFRLKHTRKLVATKTIKQGETLILNDNYGLYRTLNETPLALHPLVDISGRVAARDITAWSALTYDDFGEQG